MAAIIRQASRLSQDERHWLKARQARSGWPRWAVDDSRPAVTRPSARTVTVAAKPGGVTDDTLRDLADQFHDKHRLTYGHANPDEAIQLVR